LFCFAREHVATVHALRGAEAALEVSRRHADDVDRLHVEDLARLSLATARP
jgi:hypothetical protein